MNLLEASYVVKRLAPYYRNFGKRLVKAPKLYFLDTGLCAWLLGITCERDIVSHYARSALFETWAVTEALKWRAVRGDSQPLYYWRDHIGNEVDLLREQDGGITLVEVKSGQTYHDEWQRGLQVVQRHLGFAVRKAVLYGGYSVQERNGVHIVPWQDLRLAG